MKQPKCFPSVSLCHSRTCQISPFPLHQTDTYLYTSLRLFQYTSASTSYPHPSHRGVSFTIPSLIFPFQKDVFRSRRDPDQGGRAPPSPPVSPTCEAWRRHYCRSSLPPQHKLHPLVKSRQSRAVRRPTVATVNFNGSVVASPMDRDAFIRGTR